MHKSLSAREVMKALIGARPVERREKICFLIMSIFEENVDLLEIGVGFLETFGLFDEMTIESKAVLVTPIECDTRFICSIGTHEYSLIFPNIRKICKNDEIIGCLEYCCFVREKR